MRTASFVHKISLQNGQMLINDTYKIYYFLEQCKICINIYGFVESRSIIYITNEFSFALFCNGNLMLIINIIVALFHGKMRFENVLSVK